MIAGILLHVILPNSKRKKVSIVRVINQSNENCSENKFRDKLSNNANDGSISENDLDELKESYSYDNYADLISVSSS